jgi:predicted Zn-dependent peptidase
MPHGRARVRRALLSLVLAASAAACATEAPSTQGLRHSPGSELVRRRAVTVVDVQWVARQYLQPDAATILVIGDPAKFKAAMAPFGPVRRLPEESPG